MDEMRVHLTRAAAMPLEMAYPVVAWVIANVVRRFGDKTEGVQILRPLFEAALLGTQVVARTARRLSLQATVSTEVFGSPNSVAHMVVKPGDRAKALAYIEDWLSRSAAKYLKICDPFFGPDDLEVLKPVLEHRPNLRVVILTSLKNQTQEGVVGSIPDAYVMRWEGMSAQAPPDTEIVAIGTEVGHDLPIHDRWWITRGGGLRLGTSFKSLGIKKEAEISIIPADQAPALEAEMNRFVTRSVREYGGGRVRYESFTL
jgi:hypothetical protein